MIDETADALDATLHPHLRAAVLLAQWMERAKVAEAERDALREALRLVGHWIEEWGYRDEKRRFFAQPNEIRFCREFIAAALGERS
jgi:hypothetical protein